MRLETQRLIVRPFAERDLDALCAALSDPETMKYIEPPFSCERTARFLWEAGLCEPPLVFAVEDHGSASPKRSASVLRGGRLGWMFFCWIYSQSSG